MTVKELIEFLQTQPQHLVVAYQCYSEYNTLTSQSIQIRELSRQRDDGWIADSRPDKPTQTYLVFPGN